ncbi:hypothetical protein L208DRAFT_1419318 [Tricholoma matsutake]|nr:hypothetical protein L208DRAFT_1419318 [Tricholoma matsutake 945]
MIIPTIHTSVKFFEVDIFVKNDIPPNRSRNRVRHRVALHEIDNSVGGFLGRIGLAQLPRLVEMIISLGCPKILLQVWGFGKNNGWNCWRLQFRKLKDLCQVIKPNRGSHTIQISTGEDVRQACLGPPNLLEGLSDANAREVAQRSPLLPHWMHQPIGVLKETEKVGVFHL